MAPQISEDDGFHNVYQGCFCDDRCYHSEIKTNSYLLDRANFMYKYAWNNSVLAEQAARGNTRIHTRIEVCRVCEAG